MSGLLLCLLAASGASAGEKLDMRFRREGRTYHKIAAIAPGTDLDLSIPLQSEDKTTTVLLELRASLEAPDAVGRATLHYRMSLRGAALTTASGP